MRKLIGLLLVLAVWSFLSGCGGVGNTVSTGYSAAGAGLSINLSLSNKAVPFGGTITVQASIRDDQGNPIPSTSLRDAVVFSSILSGTFGSVPVYANGIVTTTYTAPTAQSEESPGFSIRRDQALPPSLPIADEITASFRGALAKISIMVYPLS